MNYYIAVFKSRSATLSFANLLKMKNIPCAIVNTPIWIGRACGISVKFLSDYYFNVKALLSSNPSFDGIYSFNRNGGTRIIK